MDRRSPLAGLPEAAAFTEVAGVRLPEHFGDPDAECRALHDELTAVVQSNISDRKLVLVAPYPDMDHRIALTAWRTLDTLDGLDAARIQAFIDHYERLFNPEGF